MLCDRLSECLSRICASQIEAGGGGVERAVGLVRLAQEVGAGRDGEAEASVGGCEVEGERARVCGGSGRLGCGKARLAGAVPV